MRTRARRTTGNVLTYIALALIVFVINIPVLSMIGTGLKSKSEALSDTALIPRHPDFRNFYEVFTRTTFARNLLNSAVVALTVTAACIMAASMGGYALSRFRSRIFAFYSYSLLVMQMFPAILLLIPLFVVLQFLKLVDTLYSVILSYTALNLPFSLWMMKGFFDTIPPSMEESALIDGCGRFQAFWNIVLPISAPDCRRSASLRSSTVGASICLPAFSFGATR